MTPEGLSPEEIRRYGRHLVLPEVGIEGQGRLKRARVLLIGAGGLGSPAALYLAAAGVGTIGVVDFDRVDLSNLQRQVLYDIHDVGRTKTEAAMDRLGASNPHVEVVAHELRLHRENVLDLIADYDLVLDGSDNAATRYLVNDACLVAGKPDIWGAVLKFEGQVSIFGAPGGPCYRCLFPEPPPPGTVPSCAEGGVFGVLPGMIGTLQATEAVKWILDLGDSLVGRFVIFDALRFRWREVRLPRDPECPACGEGVAPSLRDSYSQTCDFDPSGTAEGSRDEGFQNQGSESTSRRQDSSGKDIPMSIDPSQPPFEIHVEQLKAWRDEGVEHKLVDVREPQELQICGIPGGELIPMRSIPQRMEELNKEDLLVIQCHHGGRSAQVVQYLRAQGFHRATNLAGGIDAWSLRIDPTVPRY